MTLREKIDRIVYSICEDNELSGQAAEAILAAIREHLTSDEAVERAMRTRARMMWERPDTFRVRFGDCEEATRSAHLAALEGEP